ncbi:MULTISPECIES: D-tagatose-bisphosphate aldolase, class II, non-catalytic subunit [unclassified Sphingomonas]|uniref:D-tagatose-bisphosphate aldolase, class II, non-catalytic subunit n=1 Tax=unclassified Sphingomonas TaxID=196159 RepID=UPI00092A3EA5|nr:MULTISPECIES: D-tagatose-bisphosphate aldolase, class II, non-catalytic subunit [unclassified Sphingomonas]OJU17159.1 MAG: D-tagatose-bisphosphate aldolase, class II, non-catalytic subunit [Sphingomonas sp. 66-10]
MELIRNLIDRHKRGEAIGITSVCSAHPLVIEATFRHALRNAAPLVLIEATSNQVNQDGGYTGMVPVGFRAFVEEIAARTGFPLDRLALGGDHLGPNAWTALPADEAMAKAEIMVADYVRAGFGKIHLDCSMSCADDPVPLPERTIAERAARLCRAAEAACRDDPALAPVYVIGTEVPVPGGAAEDLDALAVTTPEAALATLDMHRDLFREAGLDAAWDRVIATVVQPGVEFDHMKVVDYRPAAAAALSAAIVPVDHIVFEAHSTDYQRPDALAALVRDHFAILKVGPGVTFALREALWALDAIERETVDASRRAGLRDTVVARMKAAPGNWQRYYHETGAALDLQLQYSLSDRIRYYWPDPEIAAAQARLFDNLRAAMPPLPLLSQYLPAAYAAVRTGTASLDPVDLIVAQIGATLDAYHGACNPDA